MKRILLLFLLTYFLSIPAFSETLSGKVSYTTDSAREEAFRGAKMTIPVSTFQSYLYDPDARENRDFMKYGLEPKDRNVEAFKKGRFTTGYAVNYHNNPHYTYFYTKINGMLCFIDVATDHMPKNKNVKYPIKSYRYDTNGKLRGAGIHVSENEGFLYDEKGGLITHRVGNIGYDKKGKQRWIAEEVEF